MNNRFHHDVAIIIAQYGNWGQTVACCSALWRHHGHQLAITIVDDGSDRKDREASRRFLQSKVNWVEQQHSGVTAAWNLGIQNCDAKYLVLLNNDVITKRAWVGDLVRQLKLQPGKLVGAEIRSERIVLQLQDAFLQRDCRMLAGWCLGFERATLERVGLFDESMSLYWSDTDWQLRWKREFASGSVCLGLLPKDCLHHVGHVSTSRLENRSARWHTDRAVFRAKWL